MSTQADELEGTQPSAAIVGAGASGLFAAQFLRRLRADVRVDLIEQLPVPLGLIRYGVAPDHQGTKQVARQFERLFGPAGVAFFGNVRVGVDVAVNELLELYDAVVLATGLDRSRELGVPGEALAGVLDSGALTRWINSHPDAVGPAACLGQHVVVVGNGNVAIDLVRLIAKTPVELAGSDMDPGRHGSLKRPPVRLIEVVGRGLPETAPFDPAMVRELGTLADARIVVDWPDRSLESDVPLDPRADALHAACASTAGQASTVIHFRFRKKPVEIVGDAAVEAVVCEDLDTGELLRLPATAVIKAIGFIPPSGEPAEFVRDSSGAMMSCPPRTWPVGWFRGGARGTLADSRTDAKRVAEQVAGSLDTRSYRQGHAGLERLLGQRCVRYVDQAGWDRIRAFEEARRTPDRVRTKVATRHEMLEIAGLTGGRG